MSCLSWAEQCMKCLWWQQTSMLRAKHQMAWTGHHTRHVQRPLWLMVPPNTMQQNTCRTAPGCCWRQKLPAVNPNVNADLSWHPFVPSSQHKSLWRMICHELGQFDHYLIYPSSDSIALMPEFKDSSQRKVCQEADFRKSRESPAGCQAKVGAI